MVNRLSITRSITPDFRSPSPYPMWRNFFLGIAGFMILPTIVWIAMIRFRWHEWLHDLANLDESLWLLAMIFVGTVLLAGTTARIFK